MKELRAIAAVPKEKLKEVMADLGHEVGEENFRVHLQEDGKYRVEYWVEEASPATRRGQAGA